MRRCFRRRRFRRRGATLIDVATGSMILAVLLIPSVRLIGESQSMHERLAQRETILFEARRLIEETKVALSEPSTFAAAVVTPIDRRVAVSVSDGPDLTGRVRVGSDKSLPPGELLTIVVEMWHDENRNAVFDNFEQGEELRTQWA